MVLIVDDDKRVGAALQRAIQKAGYETKVAHDGVEAYEYIKSRDCDCMLLDINMPRINGVELLLLMQAEGFNVPTILMAGFKNFENDEMRQFPGVIAFFNKPFEMSDMLKVIKKSHVAHEVGCR